jgi:cell division protein FtsI (penicillin-binding protein 3)
MEFEIREVAPPQIANPWREINTLTASYGHGLATTPLQLASAVSSVVNGGYLVRPTLVVNEEGAEEKLQPEMRVLSTKTSERIRELMRLVVSEGTGTKADVKGYRVGGKTGTADKNFNGRYDNKKKISSFVGVFPMDDPKYAIFVMVDEPKGTKATYGYATGGWVAAPAVARIIASMVSILGIPPVHEDAPENQFGSGLKQYVSMKGGDH